MEDHEIDMRPFYAAMNETAAYLRSLSTRKDPSQKTVEQYKILYNRLNKAKKTPIDYADTKSSYYCYRAAWCYICEREAKLYLKAADREKNREKKIALIKAASKFVDALKKFPPDLDKKNLANHICGQFESDWKKLNKPTKKSKSKKYQKLPKDWRKKYFDHILHSDSSYALHVALISLTGCRPSEIEHGVLVEDVSDGVKVTIESKKTHDGKYGQETRSFVVYSEDAEYAILKKYIQSRKIDVLKIKSAKAFGELLRHYSKKVFPRSSSYVSPYTFRHDFSRRIKHSLSDEQVAILLGHSTDRSQGHYGNASKNAGSIEIREIKGTKKVRLLARSNLDFSQSPSLRM